MQHESHLRMALKELADVFAFSLTPAVAATYIQQIGECTLEEIEHFSSHCMEHSVFMPRPAEILEILKAMRGQRATEAAREKFRQDAEKAKRVRCTSGFKRPEGKTILGYIEDLMSQGMTREQAVNEVCS